jgi:Flp pilus assembly protein CpaB
MNRTTQFVIGLLAIVLALAAGIYGRNAYLKEVSTYQIPVPVKDIPPYTVLDPSMFQMRDMPRTMETLPYYQAIGDLNGQIAMVNLPAGLPVANVSAVAPAQFRLADAAFEVVSIPVEPVSAVGGQIRIGQRVNLYQMVKENEENSAQTGAQTQAESNIQVTQIASQVLVVDVRTSQGITAGPGSAESKSSGSLSSGSQSVEQVQILTLALAPDQVQTVLDAVAAFKKEGGLLWTTLAVP